MDTNNCENSARRISKLRIGVSLSAVALLFTGLEPAQAQAAAPEETSPEASAAETAPVEAPLPEAAPEEAATEASGNDIVVTGSRISNSGFSSPTPVTVVGSEQLAVRGMTNIANTLNELPAFRASSTPSANTQIALTAGQNFADLRGLGANRTLVLVDGKRFVSVNPTGQVDLNLIPSALIDRAEVVTGGASAAYGSDAVAGVVNLVLRKQLNGVRGEIQQGISQRGDNSEFKASLMAGTDFADGRGHVVVAGEYNENKGVRYQNSRGWGAKGYHLIANPDYTPTNGQPRQIITPNAQLTYATYGGLINSGPLRGLVFLPDGQTTTLQYGPALAGSSYMVGGTGINPDLEKPLAYPVKRAVFYARPSFDISDSLTVYSDLSYGHALGGGAAFGGPQAALTIQRDNAYLPEAVQDRMDDAGVTSFTMGRITRDILLSTVVKTDTYRGVLGVDGKLGPDWSWNAYYNYGHTRYQARYYQNTIKANFASALDAVYDPVSDNIVCRSTLASPGNGCVPINLFGEGSPSAAAIDYVTGTQNLVTKLTQQSAGASIDGKPFSTWAGPVSIAVGGEWRSEKSVQVADPIAQASGYAISNPKSYSGKFTVKEVFAEAIVPLAQELPLLYSLELNAAGRYTDYSSSGSVETWKVGASWKPIPSLRFRGTISRDIRAPNISELFSPGALLFFTATDPANGGQQIFVPQITSGNPNLKPEKADTKTVGVIYTPEWAPGLSLSVDYYDIRIKGAIATLAAQQIVDRCFRGQTILCGLVSRDANNQLTGVAVQQVNLSEVKMNGLDIEARYRFPVGAGTLELGGLASYLDSYTVNDGTTTFQNAGTVGTQSAESLLGSTPHWRANMSATYSNGPFTGFLEGRYIGGGKYSTAYTDADINDNSVSSQTVFNLSAEYRVDLGGREVSLFGVVSNLFDEDPPIDPGVFLVASATNTSLYEVYGRSFKVGFRFKI